MMKGGARLLLATSLCALAEGARANEIVSYGYDSLGRLVRVERTGTVNNGVNAYYSYDAADNRTNVTVAAGGSGPPPSSPPPTTPSPPPTTPSPPPTTPSPPPTTPSPPPTTPQNRPPVALDDSGEGQRCQSRDFNVVANDSDPDGDALTVAALSGDPGFSVLSPTTIRYTNSGQVGAFATTYTVSDGRGGSATAVLNIEVPRDYCL